MFCILSFFSFFIFFHAKFPTFWPMIALINFVILTRKWHKSLQWVHIIRSVFQGLSDPAKIFLHCLKMSEVDKPQSIFGMMRSKGKRGKISKNSTPFATQPFSNLSHFLLLRCPTKYPYDEFKEVWGLSNPTLTNLLISAKSAWKNPARSEVDSTSLIFSEVCQTPQKLTDHMDPNQLKLTL